ncbi:MAG: Dabb family protein, partial [Planctomycetota bacterium]
MKFLLPTVTAIFCGLSACASSDVAAVDAPNVWTSPTAAISHDVFFTFRDPATADVAGLVEACQALRALPGVVHLTAGRRDPAQTRDVNETSFHVALHVEFQDQAAYDAYGPHPTHQALVKEFVPQMETVV